MHVLTGIHGAHLEDYIVSELPADVDIAASISRFAQVLAERIKHAFPDSSVEVRCDLDIAGTLPWDGQTYILDPVPGAVAEDVVWEIDALRRTIADPEWIVSSLRGSETPEPYVDAVMDHHSVSPM